MGRLEIVALGEGRAALGVDVMRAFFIGLVIVAFASPGRAQEPASEPQNAEQAQAQHEQQREPQPVEPSGAPSIGDGISIFPKVYAGASVMIGATVPFVSYGLGVRLQYNAPESFVGVTGELQWNRRGGYDTNDQSANGSEGAETLDYIDFHLGPRIGREFFFASGLLVGVLVGKGENVDDPENMNSLDMGGYIQLGYEFESPNIVLALDWNYSGLNAYDEDYLTLSNNMTWGIIFAFNPLN